MQISFPVAAVARGEGMLIKLARTLGMPGMGAARIDGSDIHSCLTTQIRKGKNDFSLMRFKSAVRDGGFEPIRNLQGEDPSASTYFRQSDQVYVVLSYSPSFVSIKLEHRSPQSKRA